MNGAPVRRPGVIAVFGGTFDPPHWGHIRAAEAVRDRLGVDEVWLVPAAIPPHRRIPPAVSASERLELVRVAIHGRAGLVASGIELEREGPSFTVDTLDRLACRRPRPAPGEAPLLFVTGSDAFREIRTWSRYVQLLERHPVVVHRRAGCPIPEALAALPVRFRDRVTSDLGAPLIPPRIFTMDTPLPDAASRAIRECIRTGQPVDHAVPPAVALKIARAGSYR